MNEFGYKGIRGKQGIKAFKIQTIPEEDKKELVKFIEKQLVKLNEYGIMSKE